MVRSSSSLSNCFRLRQEASSRSQVSPPQSVYSRIRGKSNQSTCARPGSSSGGASELTLGFPFGYFGRDDGSMIRRSASIRPSYDRRTFSTMYVWTCGTRGDAGVPSVMYKLVHNTGRSFFYLGSYTKINNMYVWWRRFEPSPFIYLL